MQSINWNDKKCFKTWNYKYIHEDISNLIIDSIAVLIGKYEVYRKQAAMLLLKSLLNSEFLKSLLEDQEAIYPYSRNDGRVTAWKKQVLSIGHCEMCGETENLEAHHIIKWSELPMGRTDPKNGECLCVKCHAKAHESDGLGNLILSKVKKVELC